MSDIDTGAAAEPTPTAAAPDISGSGTAASASPPDSQWDEQTRSYIQKLRDENKQYRERWQPYERTLSQLAEADQKVILELAQVVKQDPRAAAQWMVLNASDFAQRAGVTINDLISGSAPQQPVSLDDGPLTADRVQQLIEQRTREAQEQIRVEINRERIKRELTELGYEPQSREARWLLIEAAQNHNNDLRAAHDAFTTWQAELAKQALEKLSTPQPPATPATAASPQPPPPPAKDMPADPFEAGLKLAKQRQLARIEAARHAQTL